MKNHLSKIKEIANEFAIPGDFISGVEIKSGLINWKVLRVKRDLNGQINRPKFSNVR